MEQLEYSETNGALTTNAAAGDKQQAGTSGIRISDAAPPAASDANQGAREPDEVVTDPCVETSERYEKHDDGFFVRLKNGAVRLTTFVLFILQQLIIDDGTDTGPVRLFRLRSICRGRIVEFDETPENLRTLSFVPHRLGADAIVYPLMHAERHVYAAMQEFSPNPPEKYVYTHTGWTRRNEEWIYLHGGGGTGANGPVDNVEVELPEDLARMSLPPPPGPDQLIRALRAVIRLSEVGPLRVTVPLIAGAYRVVIAPVDFVITIVGPTGVFKTEITARVQQSWGAGFDARHVPANWSSTENSLERLAFHAKDMILQIDDWALEGTETDRARLTRSAARVVRAQGNKAGRGRLCRDTRMRKTYYPRGLVVITAEEMPGGESSRARQMPIMLARGDIDPGRLTAAQADGANGLYAEALAGFIQWIAPRLEAIGSRMIDELPVLRTWATREDAHRRSPSILADLAFGATTFLDYALEVGALTSDEHGQLTVAWKNALLEAADWQAQDARERNSAQVFLMLLSSAIASGRAYLDVARIDDSAILGEAAVVEEQTRDTALKSFASVDSNRGRSVGYRAGNLVFLNAPAALEVVRTMARAIGEDFSASPRQVKRALFDGKFLVAVDRRGGQLRYEMRRVINEAKRPYLLLHVQDVLDGPADDVEDSGDQN